LAGAIIKQPRWLALEEFALVCQLSFLLVWEQLDSACGS